jgi:hypothetical protein
MWLPRVSGEPHVSRVQPIAGKTPTEIVPPIMRATEVNVRTRSGVGQVYGEPDTWILGQSRSNRTSPVAMAAKAMHGNDLVLGVDKKFKTSVSAKLVFLERPVCG